MVLKAAVQKESHKQLLPKVTSEAAVRRCSSTLFTLYTNTNGFFHRISPVTLSADLFFLIKNLIWDGFYEKGL